MRVNRKNLFGMLTLGLLLQGCASAELAVDLFKKHNRQTETVKQAKVVAKPHYKIGNPYQEFGVWYYPKRDLTYDETGPFHHMSCLLYTSPSPRDRTRSRMPSSA